MKRWNSPASRPLRFNTLKRTARHAAGRPDRSSGIGKRPRAGPDARQPVLSGIGQDEHRTSGIRRRDRRLAQSHSCSAPPRDSAALESAQSDAACAVGCKSRSVCPRSHVVAGRTAVRRLAGISSFGASGTNAHAFSRRSS